MVHPALMNPNNRLLGWSTNDFSLYGGLPAVTIGMPQASLPGGSFVTVPDGAAPSPAPVPPPGSAAAVAPDDQPVSLDDGLDGGPLPIAPPTPTPAAPPMAAPAPSTQDFAPAVPDPIGSGSLVPFQPATPLTGSAAEPAATPTGGLTGAIGASSFAAPVIEAPAAALAPVGATLAGLLVPALATPVLESAAADVTGLVAAPLTSLSEALPAATLIDGLVGGTLPATTTVGAVEGTTALADDTLPALDATLGEVGATVEALADTAATLPAADVVATATDTVAPVTAALDDTIANAPTTLDTLDDTSARVADITSATLDTLDDTPAAPVVDVATDAVAAPLTAPVDEDFAGTDPAGGVTTLVGMVESADMFDLSQAGTVPDADAGGGSILDSLALEPELPGPSLLGDAAEDAHDTTPVVHHDDHGGLLGGL